MFWFLVIVAIVSGIIAFCGEKTTERVKEEIGLSEVGTFEYCGGNDNIIKNCKVMLSWYKNGSYLEIQYRLGLNPIEEKIPYDKIIKVSGKTEIQIKNDVTLTRLALFGIFAFGMKKERKESNYFLVIEYINEDGENQKLILGGVQQRELTAYNNLLKEYRAAKEAAELAEIEAELAELEKEENKD